MTKQRIGSLRVPFETGVAHVKRPAWCVKHGDFGWLWDDGSGRCFYDCEVEGAGDRCELVAGILEMPKGTVTRTRGSASP